MRLEDNYGYELMLSLVTNLNDYSRIVITFYYVSKKFLSSNNDFAYVLFQNNSSI